MKKLLKAVVFGALAAGVFAGPAKADQFSDFKNNIKNQTKADAQGLLKPFAEDVGGLLGGTDFNSGRNLGFPGFDVGLAATVQSKPNANNTLIQGAGMIGVPLLQASVGLPIINADIAVRGVSYSAFSIVGAGVRYGLLKSGTLTKFIPDVSVSAFYDAIKYTYFTGTHMSVDAVASFDIPVIKPFVGVGLDRTSAKIANISTALNGTSANISKPRYTVGVRFSPLPLVYVYGAYSSLHGVTGYNAGAGVKF